MKTLDSSIGSVLIGGNKNAISSYLGNLYFIEVLSD